jgi:ribosomal protein S12 methylthiotransferase
VDSERILAHLAEGGYVVGAPLDDADVIVVNTCGFLAAAREESLGVIAEALEQKRCGRTRRVVVAGCLVERDRETLYEQAPGIDAIVGVNSREAILAAVRARGRCTDIRPCGGEVHSDAGRFRLTPRHTAYLRISEGCSRRCSFCTIPALRGALRSKPPARVLDEARELARDGAVEINLIGQDTTAYGADLAGRWDLARLLRRLDGLEGLRWIRLLYAYPKRLTVRLMEAMATCERVVPYVDIPLQHISDRVLRRMGRGVSRSGVERLLARLRERVPGVTIRTTFIAGFPGETEGEFDELLDFVKAFRFEAMGVFEFSPEPGTPAAGLPDQVPDDVKRSRAEALMLAQREIALENNRRMVGREVTVLVDAAAGGKWVGRHRGQAPDVDGVCLLAAPPAGGPAARTGAFVPARVSGYDAYDLIVEAQR